jgi:hypothetical protein
MKTFKTSPKHQQVGKRKRDKTPQQLEKKSNKGTRGNRFEVDGHKVDSEE